VVALDVRPPSFYFFRVKFPFWFSLCRRVHSSYRLGRRVIIEEPLIPLHFAVVGHPLLADFLFNILALCRCALISVRGRCRAIGPFQTRKTYLQYTGAGFPSMLVSVSPAHYSSRACSSPTPLLSALTFIPTGFRSFFESCNPPCLVPRLPRNLTSSCGPGCFWHVADPKAPLLLYQGFETAPPSTCTVFFVSPRKRRFPVVVQNLPLFRRPQSVIS